jgi:hypothetical protein
MTDAQVIQKLNRIGRVLLDRHEFAAFDITSRAVSQVLNDGKERRKADREFTKAFTPNRHGEYA